MSESRVKEFREKEREKGNEVKRNETRKRGKG